MSTYGEKAASEARMAAPMSLISSSGLRPA
jgi:hypothetical protein